MSSLLGWVGDPSPAAALWLEPYPYPDAGPAGGWLADRYPYVLRILHPAYRGEGCESHRVGWADIAASRGVSVAPGVRFLDVIGAKDPNATLAGVFDERPEMGSLPAELVDVVYGHFDDAVSGLFWDGWGQFLDEPIRGCARVAEGSHGFSYQVVTAARSTEDRAVRIRTPNFWWPADRSWCAATGIDEEDTVVVSADLARLEAVHRDPRLETQLYSR
ncbi:hypothetical protein ABI214_04730 [Prescottella soli]|uniref:Uncharacterized protein n=1 Tax=Prescottella soli TaxID=1543852 RepID=A0ABW9FU39_9NOCA